MTTVRFTIDCPIKGDRVLTGVSCREEEIAEIEGDRRFRCEACGMVHVWRVGQAHCEPAPEAEHRAFIAAVMGASSDRRASRSGR